MDAAFYNQMAETTLRLIQAKGRSDLILRRESPGTFDPVEDQEMPGSMLEQPIHCIVLPVSKGTVEAFDNRLEGGTLIEENLRLLKIVAKGLTWEPRAGDTIQFENSTWTALGSTPLNPAGIPLIYNATFKRGG